MLYNDGYICSLVDVTHIYQAIHTPFYINKIVWKKNLMLELMNDLVNIDNEYVHFINEYVYFIYK